MKRKLSESEYRFDLVEEPEREDCLNWELQREFNRKHQLEVPKPWRTLDTQTKAKFRSVCVVDIFAKPPPISLAPPVYGAKIENVNGIEVCSAEVITLPQFLVRWSYSDTKLLDAFAKEIAKWLEEQRRCNPSARHFNEKTGMGPGPNPLPKLARLAAWRLHRIGGCNTAEIEEKLSELLGLIRMERTEDEGERARTKASLQRGTMSGDLNRNLSRWCKEIDELLSS